MNGNDEQENLLEGTQERKVEIVRVGGRIAETGGIKVASYEERMTSDGTLERISTTTFHSPDCNHIGVEIGGLCLCGLWWCRACAEKYGNCEICGQLVCPTCGTTKILDKKKKYHNACFWESVKRKLFG